MKNKLQKSKLGWVLLLSMLIFQIIALSSCSNKIPHKSPSPVEPIVHNQSVLDSTIKAAMKKVIDGDSTGNCTGLKADNIALALCLSECNKENQHLIVLLANKPNVINDNSKTKYKNSFNDVQKNSNNTTEVTKLKNALQIVDSQLDSVNLKNVGLSGKVREQEKEITRLRNSTTGEQSPNTNKSGNTTNKAAWYLWVIVFLAGSITGISLYIGVKAALTKSV